MLAAGEFAVLSSKEVDVVAVLFTKAVHPCYSPSEVCDNSQWGEMLPCSVPAWPER